MPTGLSLAQFGVLNHFARRNSVESPAQLASAFQVTRGAMTNTLSRLEKRDFVKIEPDPKDGRAKLVQITDKGRNMHQICIDALGPMLQSLAEGVDIAGFSRTLPQLQAVRRFLDEARN